MTRVAVLDKDNRLVGGVDAETGIEYGDLPTNGTYKWDADAAHFVPLGHGFGKTKGNPPYTNEFVMARMIETQGDAAPVEARTWLQWYNDNLRRRDEEFTVTRRG